MKFKPFLTGFTEEIEISQLIADTRAHLSQDGKYQFWADRRLAELLILIERLMPFGSIEVEKPQPAVLWALVYRENGKRQVAFSFDGPPSDAYMRLVDSKVRKE